MAAMAAMAAMVAARHPPTAQRTRTQEYQACMGKYPGVELRFRLRQNNMSRIDELRDSALFGNGALGSGLR